MNNLCHIRATISRQVCICHKTYPLYTQRFIQGKTTRKISKNQQISKAAFLGASQPPQGSASSLPVQPASPGASQQHPSAASGSSLSRGQPAFPGVSQQSPNAASLSRGQPAAPSAASGSSLPRGQPVFPGASQQPPSTACSSSLPRGQPAFPGASHPSQGPASSLLVQSAVAGFPGASQQSPSLPA